MRKSKFSDQQIIGILKEIDGGVARGDVARKYGVSEQTLSRWRAKFGGLDCSQAQTLRALEEENSRGCFKTAKAQNLDHFDHLEADLRPTLEV